MQSFLTKKEESLFDISK